MVMKQMGIGDVVFYDHNEVIMLGIITSDAYRLVNEGTEKETCLRSIKMLWTNGRQRSDYWKTMESLGDKHLTVLGNVRDHGVTMDEVVTTYYAN